MLQVLTQLPRGERGKPTTHTYQELENTNPKIDFKMPINTISPQVYCVNIPVHLSEFNCTNTVAPVLITKSCGRTTGTPSPYRRNMAGQGCSLGALHTLWKTGTSHEQTPHSYAAGSEIAGYLANTSGAVLTGTPKPEQ